MGLMSSTGIGLILKSFKIDFKFVSYHPFSNTSPLFSNVDDRIGQALIPEICWPVQRSSGRTASKTILTFPFPPMQANDFPG
jgi:hypothetical protein